MQPTCGPPSSLSPLHVTRSAPSRSAPRRLGSSAADAPLVVEQAGADVVEERDRVLRRERGQLRRGGLGREADHAVVRRMDLQDRGGPRIERRAVIGEARAVRRADLDQLRARGAHDVGDPERAADLDQLPAGHEDGPALRERLEREEQRGGAVVDDERVLGVGQGREEQLGTARPPASAPGLAIDLQVRVPGGRARHGADRGVGERRATEVRVQHDAGRVDHRREPERRGSRSFDRAGEDLVVVRRLDAARGTRPDLGERRRERPFQDRPPHRLRCADRRRRAEQGIHRRQLAAHVAGHGRSLPR